ncbi:MAG: hypothetical protein B7X08_02970 [Acidocella sp. 20-63-7]|nr:MAG: hypothetical protein B7X08_02970 [Acidocella sp. 20-63-7]HQT45974.1 CZB domain-containing protein [Acidocella sp.]
MSVQILRAVTQHVNYLAMVRKCLAEGGEYCKCTDHHNCGFGKWYDGDGGVLIREMASPGAEALWAEIAVHHAAFHDASIAAVMTREGDGTIQEREAEMVQCSTLLVNRLLELDAMAPKMGPFSRVPGAATRR